MIKTDQELILIKSVMRILKSVTVSDPCQQWQHASQQLPSPGVTSFRTGAMAVQVA